MNNKPEPSTASEHARLRVLVRGAVQGVGFRPFVYRLAGELALKGWVNNNSHGVVIEAEGPASRLDQFLCRLQADKPPRSSIHGLEASWLDTLGYSEFEIRPSEIAGSKTTLVLPDIATCPDCLRDIQDPANRRFQYPFTNCTNCGPRFSIIEALPYDRIHTSMKHFEMCPACQAEYENPHDRRFHAQPNACPVCGPRLELWDASGRVLASEKEAMDHAIAAIRSGQVLAIKGLGGFHLVVNAQDEQAVRRLRERKRREQKPFALMLPSLERARQVGVAGPLEQRLLCSPEAPIVLLQRRDGALVSPGVAPDNPYLGVMLPYTPLHHLLLSALDLPVVATSGNLSDEPICIDQQEALVRLGGIADLFLVHNRPIVRHVDDSIVRVLHGRELVMRRARGYAPLPVTLAGPGPVVMGVGAHLKNTVALAVGEHAFVSQHIGDLETEQSLQAFRHVMSDLERLYDAKPEWLAADAHPDYLSTREARASGLPVVSVQHHFAHVLSCMAENELAPPVLGVSWDGTGFGLDGAIWGGEFLLVNDQGFERVGHLRPFPLLGGEAAVREPRRVALALLQAAGVQGWANDQRLAPVRSCSASELRIFTQMLEQALNAPQTTSAGRLFDGIASLLGLCQRIHFEGQAAMALEYACGDARVEEPYSFEISMTEGLNTAKVMVIDWAPMLRQILEDLLRQRERAEIAVKFHLTLAEIIVAVSRRAGQNKVVLSGGCFQNQRLVERVLDRLKDSGFRAYWHQRIPPNDGGIALGQVVEARRQIAKTSKQCV